jgi:hypothetical protein
MAMNVRKLVRIVLAILCGLFCALYIAAKIHFFTRYDPLKVGSYLEGHSIYWVAMAVTAFLIWLKTGRFPQDRQWFEHGQEPPGDD